MSVGVLRGLILSAFLGAVAVGAHAQIVIDTFEVEQHAQLTHHNTVITGHSARDPSILGGERNFRLSMHLEGAPVMISASEGTLRLGNGYDGTVEVWWDGVNAGAALDPTGLGGIDLTNGGANDRFRLRMAPGRGDPLYLQVYTSATRKSHVSFALPVAEFIDLPFAQFVSDGSDGGADFKSVGAIAFKIYGESPYPTGTAIGWLIATNDKPSIGIDATAWTGTYPRRLRVSPDAQFATVDIERIGPVTETSTVRYATRDSTALAGLDYTATDDPLTFAPGETRKSVRIPILQDALFEDLESFHVTLSTPGNARLGPMSTAEIYLIGEAPLPTISVNDVSQREGNAGRTALTFTATLSRPIAFPTRFEYWVVVPNLDVVTMVDRSDPWFFYYAVGRDLVTIPAGETTGTFTIDLGPADTVVEPDEKRRVYLRSWDWEMNRFYVMATVLDDDGAANLSLSKAASAESVLTGGSVLYTLTVANSGPDRARNVVVTDRLPAGMTALGATTPYGTCTGTSVVICTLSELQVNQEGTISLLVEVTGAGSMINTATVAAPQPDPVPANNTAAATLTAEPESSPVPVNAPAMLALLIVALAVAAVRVVR